MKRFVIVGLSNFGSALAETLHAQGHDVAVIDRNTEKVDRIASGVSRAAVADATQLAALERLGARGADVAVVATGDLESSILATLALRDLGVPDIVAKVISIDHARILEKLGVTEVVFPERDSAQHLSTRIANRGILNYFQIYPSFSIQEMHPPGSWQGKTLRALEIRRKYRVSVIAIRNAEKPDATPIPDPSTILSGHDRLLIAGTDADLQRVASLT
jgi:trk system potassium uptake protein TrkA